MCTTPASITLGQLHRTDTQTMLPQEREGVAYEGQEQLQVFKLSRRNFVSQSTQQSFKLAASH